MDVRHCLLATREQLIYAQGIRYFLRQHSGVTVWINPKPIGSKTIVQYLIIIDRADAFEDLRNTYCLQRLIYIYSSPFHLYHFPFKMYHETISIWGQKYLTPDLLQQFLELLAHHPAVHTVQSLGYLQHPLANLSTVDVQLFRCMAKGKHTEEISQKLGLSKSTIERHKRHWKERLGLEALTDCGLIALLYRQGVIKVFHSNSDSKKALE